MTFLNPWLLLGALGVSLPIIAHMLNRHQVRTTAWAAMRFLNRSVRVRSRQLRLRDILLLILRCLALLLLVLAFSRPTADKPGGAMASLGDYRAGVVIAIDASYSMLHSDGTATRFEKAIEKTGAITRGIPPGNPVTLLLLATDHRVVARNVAFDPDHFADILSNLTATSESLDLDSVPRRLKNLAAELKESRKEIYIITDMQEQDWKPRSAWLHASFKDLARNASTFIIPVGGGSENLAITSLELASGVLRKGTPASYRVTVRNSGDMAARNVKVNGLINNISVDVKIIPFIAPGTSETVLLSLSFRDPGPVRISAELDKDALEADNARRAVAVIRDHVSVLCVEGSSGPSNSSGELIATALRASGTGKTQEDLNVQTVSWVDLPAQDLKTFDVVALADVPDITAELARSLESYVRAGNGLIWFAGDYVKANVWNQRSALEGTPLLPAVLEESESTSDAMGIGRPLDPSLTDHPVCRPLFSLPEDLLSETRFRRLIRVTPSPTSATVLSLAGSDSPVLLEHSLGRGHVFMFTTSAGPAWNNMAVNPVFPMLLQQMVTYLTAREFETPRMVADTLSLSYVDQPDTTDAVFDTPSGETITVPVQEYRDQYVALLESAREPGFYLARVSLQATGMPIAVNVDTRESRVKCMTAEEAARTLQGTGARITPSDAGLSDGVDDIRAPRSFWRFFMLTGLAFFIIESLFAEWLSRKSSRQGRAGNERAEGGKS
ncbi:MAG: BatA domain-containing protein [Lentisphaeria bacterium]|nr:BatA domain-containing protein [Lentisphaeria bacterium]